MFKKTIFNITSFLLIIILFGSTAYSDNEVPANLKIVPQQISDNSALLNVSQKEGLQTLFGISWNSLYDQNIYSEKVLKNPLATLNKIPDLPNLNQNFEDMISLVERNLTFRAKAVAFIKQVKSDRCNTKNIHNEMCRDNRSTLTPDQTDRLAKGSKEFLLLRYLNTLATKIYQPKAASILNTSNRNLKKVKLSDRQQVEVLLSLSAALTLFDNYILLVKLFEQDKAMRLIFSNGINTLGVPAGAIKDISRNSRKLKYRIMLAKLVRWVNRAELKLKPHVYTELDQKYNYLLTYIKATAAYKIFSLTVVERSLLNFQNRINDGVIGNFMSSLLGAEREVADKLSATFGNTVGMYEKRKGYMYIGKDGILSPLIDEAGSQKVNLEQRKNFHTKMRESLEPGDVLLEKTPFRLTDKFIPGHWGHVAVWTGTIEDLKERGLWGHITQTIEWISLSDAQKAYIQDRIKGHPNDPVKDTAILEALRSGVQLNDLYHFLNIDDVGVLKPKLRGTTELEKKKELAQIIAKGFSHVLKDYDFNFDVSDTNKIVCSEVAWHTYTDCHFKTKVILGRASINPDDVADAVFGDLSGRECFSVDYIVHDGKEVDPKEYDLKKVLESLNEKSTLE